MVTVNGADRAADTPTFRYDRISRAAVLEDQEFGFFPLTTLRRAWRVSKPCQRFTGVAMRPAATWRFLRWYLCPDHCMPPRRIRGAGNQSRFDATCAYPRHDTQGHIPVPPSCTRAVKWAGVPYVCLAIGRERRPQPAQCRSRPEAVTSARKRLYPRHRGLTELWWISVTLRIAIVGRLS